MPKALTIRQLYKTYDNGFAALKGIDLDVEEGVRRSHLRDSPLDRFESEAIEFKNRIRAAYLKRQDHNSMRIVLVDAAQSIQEIEFEIATRIDDLHARSLG